jgi:hypothetical protein
MRVVPSRGVTGGSAPRVRTGTSLKGKGDSSGPSIRSATLNLRCKLLKTLKKERLNPNIIVFGDRPRWLPGAGGLRSPAHDPWEAREPGAQAFCNTRSICDIPENPAGVAGVAPSGAGASASSGYEPGSTRTTFPPRARYSLIARSDSVISTPVLV